MCPYTALTEKQIEPYGVEIDPNAQKYPASNGEFNGYADTKMLKRKAWQDYILDRFSRKL
ncbi:MAG: hypothetical protein ACI4LP_05085 [Anaerovoracaceae bacterium]